MFSAKDLLDEDIKSLQELGVSALLLQNTDMMFIHILAKMNIAMQTKLSYIFFSFHIIVHVLLVLKVDVFSHSIL